MRQARDARTNPFRLADAPRSGPLAAPGGLRPWPGPVPGAMPRPGQGFARTDAAAARAFEVCRPSRIS